MIKKQKTKVHFIKNRILPDLKIETEKFIKNKNVISINFSIDYKLVKTYSYYSGDEYKLSKIYINQITYEQNRKSI